jgi:hypothetical protein
MRERGFSLYTRRRSLAARLWRWPVRYLRTLRDTLSIQFWGFEAVAAIVFVVGRVTNTVLVSAAALVAGGALAGFGLFVAALSFTRDVRDDRMYFRRLQHRSGGPTSQS